jgi:8-oxo-dGTP pyrophosphatase MutT (NUDIX family)
MLLVRRSDDGRWCLPCGWVEPNESPAEAAVREAREETGLIVRANRLWTFTGIGPGVRPHSAVAIVYLCEGCRTSASHEVTEVATCRRDDRLARHRSTPRRHRCVALSAPTR